MTTPARPFHIQPDLTEALHDGIVQLTTSREWERYLAYQAAFHEYSFGNVVLITSQRPGATRVAGFSTWKSYGRWVRRGERAISILAPVRRRVGGATDLNSPEDAERSRIVGFRRVGVFDVSQTDGAPLPEVVRRLSGTGGAEAIPGLTRYADALGYSVEEGSLDGITNGDCDFARRRIRLEIGNAPDQKVKTLAHEIAHAVLHESEGDRALAELEAESVAFVVCRSIGLDSGVYSFGYVASWAGGGEVATAAIRRSGERIARTAAPMIGALESLVRDVGACDPGPEAALQRSA